MTLQSWENITDFDLVLELMKIQCSVTTQAILTYERVWKFSQVYTHGSPTTRTKVKSVLEEQEEAIKQSLATTLKIVVLLGKSFQSSFGTQENLGQPKVTEGQLTSSQASSE